MSHSASPHTPPTMGSGPSQPASPPSLPNRSCYGGDAEDAAIAGVSASWPSASICQPRTCVAQKRALHPRAQPGQGTQSQRSLPSKESAPAPAMTRKASCSPRSLRPTATTCPRRSRAAQKCALRPRGRLGRGTHPKYAPPSKEGASAAAMVQEASPLRLMRLPRSPRPTATTFPRRSRGGSGGRAPLPLATTL